MAVSKFFSLVSMGMISRLFGLLRAVGSSNSRSPRVNMQSSWHSYPAELERPSSPVFAATALGAGRAKRASSQHTVNSNHAQNGA